MIVFGLFRPRFLGFGRAVFIVRALYDLKRINLFGVIIFKVRVIIRFEVAMGLVKAAE